MKLTTDTVICDLYGTPFPKAGAPEGDHMKISDVCVFSLYAEDDEDRREPMDARIKRYRLAQRFVEDAEIELRAEQIAMLKERIHKTYGIAVLGPACDILDPEDK